MRRTALMAVALVLTIATGIGGQFSTLWAGTSATHRVTGKVIAITTQEQPHTIVVSVGRGASELIVGATVGEKVSIRRGRKSVSLEHLRLGETVQLTYQKTSSGLVAVSIAAK